MASGKPLLPVAMAATSIPGLETLASPVTDHLRLQQRARLSRLHTEGRTRLVFSTVFVVIVMLQAVLVVIQAWQTVLKDPDMDDNLVQVFVHVYEKEGGHEGCQVQDTVFRQHHGDLSQDWGCSLSVDADELENQTVACVCKMRSEEPKSVQSKILVPLFAARTLNAPSQSRVTLSLR